MDLHDDRPVVAGVDGSVGALAAARWAADRAAAHGARLRLVAATGVPRWDPAGLPPLGSAARARRAREAAAAAVATSASEAARTLPPARVSTAVVDGAAAPVLHAESADARLVVVGSRGHGGFAGLLLGSTAGTVAASARCPVVVVRGVHAPHGPVVVGVDGSAWTEPALAAAFAEAAARGTGVVAVHAWADDVVDPAVTALVDPDGRAEDERRLLDDALAPWADKHPDVRVRRVLAHDRPARALVTESGWAQLVVVGSRGRGGVAGMPLGSVGRALLSHAHCPVLVARDGPG